MRRTVFVILAVLLGTASAQMEWTCATPSAPWAPRVQNTLVTFGDTMWLAGGIRCWPDTMHYNDVWKSADGVSWLRATESAAWSPRFGSCSAVFHDTMWLVGGGRVFSTSPQDVWKSVNGVDWFCAVESAPWLCHAGALVVFRDTMWLAGGLYWNGARYAALDDVWKSGDGRNWVLADSSAPWGARGGHGLVVFRDTIWLTGGHDWVGVSFGDVWKSGDGDSWLQVTSSAPWGPKYVHASVVAGDSLWVMGGWKYNVLDRTNDVWWSTDGNSWEQANDSADWQPRAHPTASVHDGRLWLMAGDTTPAMYAGTNDVWFSQPIPGIEERPPLTAGCSGLAASFVRGVLRWEVDGRRQTGDRAELLDAGGRRVLDLHPGGNDVRHLSPGIYFVRAEPSAVHKVVIAR